MDDTMNTTMDTSSKLTHLGITCGQVVTCVLYLVVGCQIYRRQRFNLEPVHIYELNILLACTLFAPIEILCRYLARTSLCMVTEWLRYYNWHHFITGVIMAQADRWDKEERWRRLPIMKSVCQVSEPLLERRVQGEDHS